MAANVIDSFLIALGFTVDPAGLKGVKNQVEEAKQSVLSLGTAFKAFVAGFAIKEIASIGSTFEQNQIQIAGFMSALGMSSDFNAGLKDAQSIMEQITIDAAKLPGEAQEYIEVFKANAAFLKNGMPGANPSQIADFTNKLTAVAKTVASGLDANQIGRESSQLLAVQGRAGGHNILWQKLMPFLMQVDGQAKITAQSFNLMTQPQRVQLLQAAFAKLQPMLDRSATSFDAMWGAAVSAVKQLTRLATAPLFEGMKRGLDALNATFYDSSGHLNDFGKNFVDTAKRIVGWIGQVLSMGGAFVSWLVHSKVGMWGLKAAAVAVGLALAGMALESTISTVAKLVKGVGNLKRALLGGLFIALVLIAEDIYTFIKGGDSLTGKLLNDWPVAFRLAVGAVGLLGAAFVAAKVAALASFAQIAAAAVAAGAQAAAAWLPVVAPFILIAAAIYGAIKAIDILDEKFEGFRHLRMEVRGALGLADNNEQAALTAEAAGNRARATPESQWQKWEPPTPGSARAAAEWSPATGGGPGGAGGGSSVVDARQVTIGELHVHSNSDDAKSIGRETAREITRNAQKGYR